MNITPLLLRPTALFFIVLQTFFGSPEKTALTSAQIEVSHTITHVTCKSGFDGSIEISIPEGLGTYSFSWSGPGGFSSKEKDISQLAEGVYELEITDATGLVLLYEENFTVLTADEEDPVVRTKNITVQLDDAGNIRLSPEHIDNGSSDNCAISELWIVPGSFTCENTGSNEVTLYARDSNGNEASAPATVTVEDATPPAVITRNISVTLDSSGKASIAQDALNDGSSDACGTLSFSTSQTDFTCADLGENSVTLVVTDSSNNESTATATVTVKDVTPPTIITENIVVELGPDGKVSISLDALNNGSSDNCGITGFFTSQTEFTCSDLGNNVVTFTITDASGNTTSGNATVTVTDNIAPVIQATEDITAPTAAGGCSAVVSITPPAASDNCSVGVPVGTRSDGKEMSASFDLGETTITWEVKDSSENSAIPVKQIITVEDKEAPAVPQLQDIAWGCEFSLTAPTTTDNCSGTITGTTENLVISDSQTITWTFRDEAGNTSTASQKIVITPITLDLEASPVTCNEDSDGSVTVRATGGIAPLNYSIDGGSFTTSSTFTNLSGGTYLIAVKDKNGCAVERSLTISEPDMLRLETPSTITQVSCFGGSDGSIQAGVVNGGNGGYQYSLDNEHFSSQTTFENLATGNYTLFVIDSKGCALQESIAVPGPQVLQASLSRTNVSCHGGSDGKLIISNAGGGSGSYEYSIRAGEWQSGNVFNGLPSGSYKVRIRDAANRNCIIILHEGYNISQPAQALTATTSSTRTTTFGTSSGMATVNASGGTAGYTYKWRVQGSETVLQNTQTATGLAAGIYEVTVTDSKGCEFTTTATIIETIDAQISTTSLCVDSNDEIRTSTFQIEEGSARGGIGDPSNFNYKWNFGEGALTDPADASLAEIFTVEYSNSGDKTITLTITDESGESTILTFIHYVGKCFEYCGSSSNFELDLNSFFIGDAFGNPVTPNNCNNSDPKYLYVNVLKSANGYSLSFELNYTIASGGSTTEYEVRNACFYEGRKIPEGLIQLNRVEKDGPADAINWQCGEILTLTNLNIRWANSDNDNNNPNNLKCGSGPRNMCYGLNVSTVVSTPLQAVAEQQNVLCKGVRSGSVKVFASGGTGSYSYTAVDEAGTSFTATGDLFSGLPAGVYTITVSDDKIPTPAQIQLQVTIEEPAAAITAKIELTNISCYGAGDGRAKVTASGGTAPYTYQWNDPQGQQNATASNLSGGSYTVTIMDANGCQLLEEVTLPEPAELTLADAGPDQEFSCGFTSTNLQANTAVTGIGKWTLISSTGGNITDIHSPTSYFTAPAGSHHLRWTISNEDGTCFSSSDVVIRFSGACSTLDFDGVNDFVEFENTYSLGTGPFSLEAWIKPDATTGTRTVLSKRSENGNSGYELSLSGGSPTFRWNGNNVTTSHKVDTNRWYHLGVTFDGNQVKLYVDGIALSTKSAANPAATPAPFLIGATHNSLSPRVPVNLYKGWIEEVRIWKKPLTEEQIRFMMNQRLKNNNGRVRGEEIPLDVPGSLSWSDLSGYYKLLGNEVANGSTPDDATEKVNGQLRNIETSQENSAPLPYVSRRDGIWTDLRNETTPWLYGAGFWDIPNGRGINNTPIDWNIVKISNVMSSGNKDITLLGLVSEAGKLNISDPATTPDETNMGKQLRITKYLKLNGKIDLIGESQLIQDEQSIIDPASTGYLEKDQQGTASSFNYNYWSSPVSSRGHGVNYGYNLEQVLRDGSNTATPLDITFDNRYHFADGAKTTPIRISTYWIHKFFGKANQYSQWRAVGKQGLLKPGEGYTMKGTQGISVTEALEKGLYQNYTFSGLPNNGPISLEIGQDQNYLIGNPYPSALDADEFIRDNLAQRRNGINVFNGSLYFWSHFAGRSHYLQEYVGGYAVYNLSGGVKAIANDARIGATEEVGGEEPQRYIPVGQAFFINTLVDPAITNPDSPVEIHGGQIRFNNTQRTFQRENPTRSVFHKPEEKQAKLADEEDKRMKIRLSFRSPAGYLRELLVTADQGATDGIDLGYDAPVIENNPEDLYWIADNLKLVIQGVPLLTRERELALGLKVKEEKPFSISISRLENVPDGLEIYLKDRVTDSLHNLRTASFESVVLPGTTDDRFKLVFGEFEPDRQEEPAPEVIAEELQVFYLRNSRELTILNPQMIPVISLKITNILGQQVQQHYEIPKQAEVQVPVNRLSAGIYVVKVYTQKGSISKKIILK